jgi:hypothetical protein
MLPFSRVCACVLLCFALGCDGPRLESVAPEPARLNWTGAKAATVWSFVVGAAQADRRTEAARSANVGSGILRACHPDAPCSNPSQLPLSSAP